MSDRPRAAADVRLERVEKSFDGKTRAVDGIDLTVAPGEFFALLGPSGCGKTTTLRLIAGFEAPDEGEVLIGGRTVAKAGSREFVPPEARGVGIVFQDYALFPHLTLEDNVAFGLADLPAAGRRVRTRDVPEVVYHRPATPFVAEFVGDADFLAGTVTEAGIATELGAFPNPDGLRAGTRVRLMIRPDDIGFAPEPGGHALIVRRDFRGPVNVYCLRLPSGQRVHASQPSTAIFEPGTRVRAEAELLHVVTF